mmetsp:Transcript_34708/g.86590  ORF Transcript_34708/g.86590 Transcript_34708/m.86590 type:complete len:213 (-) Transcript_34708:889-1527(-)
MDAGAPRLLGRAAARFGAVARGQPARAHRRPRAAFRGGAPDVVAYSGARREGAGYARFRTRAEGTPRRAGTGKATHRQPGGGGGRGQAAGGECTRRGVARQIVCFSQGVSHHPVRYARSDLQRGPRQRISARALARRGAPDALADARGQAAPRPARGTAARSAAGATAGWSHLAHSAGEPVDVLRLLRRLHPARPRALRQQLVDQELGGGGH